jgi:preprotein translocase subunit SecF
MKGAPIDLVGRRGWFYLFSLLLILPGIISLIIPPRLKPGIDFSSGSTFTVRFEEAVTADDLKAGLADLDHPEARVQHSGPNEFLVRTKTLQGATSAPPVGPAPPSERDEIESGLRDQFGNMVNSDGVASDTQGFLEFNSISATVSRDIAKNAGYALLAASSGGPSAPSRSRFASAPPL